MLPKSPVGTRAAGRRRSGGSERSALFTEQGGPIRLCAGANTLREEGSLQEGGPMGMGPFQEAPNSTQVPIP